MSESPHERKMHHLHTSHKTFGTMKKVVLRIQNDAFERFMGMVSLCPQVEVIDTGCPPDFEDETVRPMAEAISELRTRRVLRMPRDYTYLMTALNEGVIDKVPYFYTPMDFLNYLNEMGFDCLPSKTTLYDTAKAIQGRYPDWRFADKPKDVEAIRRKNIIVQLLSAFGRAQRRMSEGMSEKT